MEYWNMNIGKVSINFCMITNIWKMKSGFEFIFFYLITIKT